MINIFLIFIIFILIIVTFYIINNSLTEKFTDFTGAHPNSSFNGWSTGTFLSGYDFSDYCTPGIACSTEDGWGIYNNNCECIVPGVNNTLEVEEENIISQESEEERRTNIISTNLNGCITNNQNFDKYCKSINPTYGVKNINRCDSNNSKVECGANYINGVYYGESIITPCMNKSDDFDTWCKYYNTKDIPDGFNVNSIGADKILLGSEGGCFLEDGKPDFSKARALCNYNSIDGIKKLNRSNELIDYNVFTTCLPIKNSNFVLECGRLLDDKEYNKIKNTNSLGNDINNINNVSSDDCKLLCDSNNDCYGFTYNKNNGSCFLKNSNVINASGQDNNNYDLYLNDKSRTSHAIEIMGYDCNPGFARAKCIKKDDILFVNNNNYYKSIFDTS